MRESDVSKCQIQEWYSRFCRVSVWTYFHVRKSFVDCLLEDGPYLSRSSKIMPTGMVATCPDLQSEGYKHWDVEDDKE